VAEDCVLSEPPGEPSRVRAGPFPSSRAMEQRKSLFPIHSHNLEAEDVPWSGQSGLLLELFPQARVMGKWERLEMVTGDSTEWQEMGVCDQGDVSKSKTDRQTDSAGEWGGVVPQTPCSSASYQNVGCKSLPPGPAFYTSQSFLERWHPQWVSMMADVTWEDRERRQKSPRDLRGKEIGRSRG